MKKKFGNAVASVEVEATIEPIIAPVDESKPIPADVKCQEAATGGNGLYIPCGKHATTMIRHERDRRSYYMCEGCAEHNINRRGGKLIASSKKLTPKVLAALEDRDKQTATVAEPIKPETIKRADLPFISTLPAQHMMACKDAFEELEMQTYYTDETGKKRRREDRIKELKTKVGDICTWAHQPGYRHGELFLTSKYNEGRETMDRGLLMENGVTAQQIKDSMKKGDGYVTNTFGRIADKDD